MNDLRREVHDCAGTAQDDTRDHDPPTIREAALGWSAGQLQGSRDEQQDSYGWLVEPQARPDGGADLLLVVADGMGGHSAGALASRVAVDAFIDTFRASKGAVSERLEDAIDQANQDMRDTSVREDAEDMGTTLLAAHIAGRRLRWISVGDSPMWLLSTATGRRGPGRPALTRLNQDHSMKPVLAQLVEAGEITAAEFARDGRRNELRSAIAGDDIRLLDFHERPVELADGNVLILATDGLETLSEDEIAALVAEAGSSPTAIVQRLLAAVQQRAKDKQDNTTVVVYAPPTQPARHRPASYRRSAWLWPAVVVLAGLLLGLAVAFLGERVPRAGTVGPAMDEVPMHTPDAPEGS